MPRKRGIPGICRHKGSGQAYVRLAGRCVYLGPFDGPDVQANYDRALAEWLARGRALPQVYGPTVAEIMAAYIDFATRYYVKNGRPTSEQANIRSALTVVRRLYAAHPAASFGPTCLKAVRQVMIDEGIVRASVNKRIGRVKGLFRWAVENELVPADVLHGLRAVAGLKRGRSAAKEAERVLPVPDAHVDAVLPHVSAQVAAMIELQRLTGCRSGEIIIMRPVDLDTTGPVWTYRPTSHKTEHHGHIRVIDLGPRAQDIIRPFLAGRPVESFLFAPSEAEAQRRAEQHKGRVTPLSCGNRPGTNKQRKPRCTPGPVYTVDSYRRAIQRGCELAHVPAWHPHQLRHVAATRFRKLYGLETARLMLGHRHLAMTELYAEVDRDKARAIAQEVG